MKNILETAQNLAAEKDGIQAQIQLLLSPLLAQYIDLLRELKGRGYSESDFKADTFVEIEYSGKYSSFLFRGEEYYDHGDDVIPSISVPFAFVADPEGYIAKAREEHAEDKARIQRNKEIIAQNRIDRLRAELAKAEQTLAAVVEQGTDSIKIEATANQVAKIKSDLVD